MKPTVLLRVYLNLLWFVLPITLDAKVPPEDSRPFEDANQIFVTTTLADQQAYNAITQVLMDQSILFAASTDGLLISSQPNQFKDDKNMMFVGRINVVGGVVKLSGQMRSAGAQSVNSGAADFKAVPIRYHKGKESLSKAGFLFLDELAHQLRPALNGIIRYKYQKESI